MDEGKQLLTPQLLGQIIPILEYDMQLDATGAKISSV